MGQPEAGRLARHRDRQRPEQVAPLQDRGPAEQLVVATFDQGIRGRVEAGRRDHAEVDRVRRAVGLGDDHHAAAAETAHPGLEHPERKRSGERGVDGVAARGKNVRAHLCRTDVLGGDQPAAGVHHAFADRPGFLRRSAHDLLQP